MKNAFLVMAMCLMSSISLAQQGNIKGKLINKISKKGIEFTNVSLLSGKDSTLISGTITDTLGVFQFTNIKQGTYILSFSSVEYLKTLQRIEVNQPNIDLHEIALTINEKLLSEVMINGERPAFTHQADKVVLNVASNSFFKSATNALDILKRAPSLQVNADGSLLMRGKITPTVLVDGKPILLTGDELNNYLNSLMPETIESVELVNNPSAKYDAEFKGVIDIKLKRDKNLGLQGSANSTFIKHRYAITNNSLNLGYKTKRLAYTTRLNYVNGSNNFPFYSEQNLTNGNQIITDFDNKINFNLVRYQLGVNYSLAQNQTLGIDLNGSNNERVRDGLSVVSTTNNGLEVEPNVLSKNIALPSFNINTYAAKIFYDAEFVNANKKKSQLSFFALLFSLDDNRGEDILNTQKDAILSHWQSNLINNILIRSSQLDYATPLGKGSFEAGAKYSFSTTKNDIKFFNYENSLQNFVLDTARNNRLNYDEYITAVYFSYSQNFDKLSYKIGLRAENTETKANSFTNNSITENSYFNWLPSANISYKINNGERLSLFYSKRLTRPTFFQLTPFRFYSGPNSYLEGNPLLLPITTNLVSLVYSNNVFSSTLNVGQDKNQIITYPSVSGNTVANLYQNSTQNNYANLEINFTNTIKKWWKMTNNFGVYYDHSAIPYQGKTYEKSVSYLKLTGSQLFTFAKNYLINLSYNYQSESGNALYSIKPLYSIDFGIQKTFLKGALNTKLNFEDIFFSSYQEYIFREKALLDFSYYNKNLSQRAVLSLTYNFGKSTYKAKQKARTEEEGRVGN